jgi:5-methylcytosine-specific restriction endonuclease McrA
MNTEAYKLWRKANKDKVAKYMRTWRAKHPDVALANSRKWIENNRQKTRDAAKSWYDAHREEINAKRREDRKLNPEKYSKREKQRVRDKNKMVKYRAKHYEKHKERVTKENAAYHKAHPEVRRTINSRRRANLLSGGRHTTQQWLDKLAAIGMICVYCTKALDFSTLTKDHVIPLSKGGTDDIENVVPSCLRCNQTKSSKLVN